MKPADVNSSTYFDFGLENNKEDPKFEVGDHIRIWNHRNIFGQGYTPNWFEEIFLIKKKTKKKKKENRKDLELK